MVHEERLSEKIYIVSELAKTDLLEYLEVKGALRESVVRRLFYDLASGVNYMHTENVAHRDIKWLVKIARSNSEIKKSSFLFGRILVKNPKLPEFILKIATENIFVILIQNIFVFLIQQVFNAIILVRCFHSRRLFHAFDVLIFHFDFQNRTKLISIL